jgi:cobalamin 5'-phosphate synthase/cobalamin synthase
VRRLLAAVAFLTRVPVPIAFDQRDVGRAALAFPLVGALLGGATAGLARALHPLPPALAAVLLVAFAALATGALHLDGLADSADGFGGGRTRDDVLRIMRDHAIGAYGAVALILLIGVKVTALASLLDDWRPLVLAPALGRWASVPLGRALPYARREGLGGIGAHVGAVEVIGATAIAIALAVGAGGWRGGACLGAVTLASVAGAIVCWRKIGGVTGDTLGANTELCEALVYILWIGLR